MKVHIVWTTSMFFFIPGNRDISGFRCKDLHLLIKQDYFFTIALETVEVGNVN